MSSIASNPSSRELVDVGGTTSVGSQISLHIPHDLAVQIVGSDAGKARRFRPHNSMTTGAPPAETQAVSDFMQPFLQREIDRVQNRSAVKIRGLTTTATPAQAHALKGFCQRFAASLRIHLDKHPDDDRMHRTRQRLGQAVDVIRQINDGLGVLNEDIIPIETRWRETLASLKKLHHELQELSGRVDQAEGIFAFTVKEAVMELLPPIQTVLAQNAGQSGRDGAPRVLRSE